jgi:hypothetical protein
MKVEATEEGRSLMMRKVLMKPKKDNIPESMFRTACKARDRVCKVIIYSGSTDNLVSMEMVEKLKLNS